MKASEVIWSSGWKVIFLAVLMFFQSCVSEDELDFPDDPGAEVFSPSVAIVSVLRAIDKHQLADSSCFVFHYPLELQFNNNLSITISDFAGLQDLAANVNKNQHIDAVEFPFLVSKDDVVKTIGDEQAFIDLLDVCSVPTLRDEFDHFFTQCFDLVYPVEMVDLDSDTVTISSQEAYFAFELQQGFDQQPKFIYPISLIDYADHGTVDIQSPFELFELFDTCKKCPQLFFHTDSLTVNRFRFRADFAEMDRVFSYDWYIDGVKVETDGSGVQGDNLLTETFQSGDYEICIKTSLPEDDCFSGTTYCHTISVDACPFVSYETEQININTYKFIANFLNRDLLVYYWVIYLNQDIIFSEIEDEGGDNLLTYMFEPGIYQVCLEAENEGCPEVLKFCTEVIIE